MRAGGDRYLRPPMHSRLLLRTALPVALLMALTGCTINRDIMFKTPYGQDFPQFVDTTAGSLIIQPNDVIQFRLFANDGFKIIDLVSEGGAREANFLNRNVFTYTIESDGLVKLPLIGRIDISRKTIRQAEAFLEERYSAYYNRPFVQLQVTSRRVMVFTGAAGSAKVINLENNNTTLIEVLARAGGLAKRGDARRVRLFRMNLDGTRSTYQFDLSSLDGLKYADVVMQGDDILYVQPNAELAREIIADLQPLITLLTSVILVYGIVRNFGN